MSKTAKSFEEHQSKLEALRRSLTEQHANAADPIVLEALQEKIARIKSQTQTEGSAVVTGDVGTQGGELVGRGKIVQAIAERSVVVGRDAQENIIVKGTGFVLP